MNKFPESEEQLPKRYLDKNHVWRIGKIKMEERGPIDNNFPLDLGSFGAIGVEDFCSTFGINNVKELLLSSNPIESALPLVLWLWWWRPRKCFRYYQYYKFYVRFSSDSFSPCCLVRILVIGIIQIIFHALLLHQGLGLNSTYGTVDQIGCFIIWQFGEPIGYAAQLSQ
ncbi:MAG: hypothetical protein IPJ43_20650 [Saprospiraceae bacterium]|nr:hypothetical protein [Saprospiraceae bacterium]